MVLRKQKNWPSFSEVMDGVSYMVPGYETYRSIKDAIADAFYVCSKAKVIPGATERECGNYKLNDLKGAVELCRKFSTYLHEVNHDCLVYPK